VHGNSRCGSRVGGEKKEGEGVCFWGGGRFFFIFGGGDRMKREGVGEVVLLARY